MIIVIIVFIICVILLMYNIYHDKFMFLTTKLNLIEEKINSTLIKRKDLIKEAEKIIKEVVDTDKDIFQGLKNINNDKMNMIVLDRKLLVYVNEFYLIKDKYKKLSKNEDFQKTAFLINETEDLLNAYKDYYNDYAGKYNKLIKKFPISIISIIKKRKEKSFFDKKNTSDNDYNDFKY